MTEDKKDSINTIKSIDPLIQTRKRPITMKKLWEWWKRVARKIGDFQARILLTIFYFIILGPFALAIRLGSDPLAIKASSPHGWHHKTDVKGTPIEQATKQS
jgi:hypothetical protein